MQSVQVSNIIVLDIDVSQRLLGFFYKWNPIKLHKWYLKKCYPFVIYLANLDLFVNCPFASCNTYKILLVSVHPFCEAYLSKCSSCGTLSLVTSRTLSFVTSRTLSLLTSRTLSLITGTLLLFIFCTHHFKRKINLSSEARQQNAIFKLDSTVQGVHIFAFFSFQIKVSWNQENHKVSFHQIFKITGFPLFLLYKYKHSNVIDIEW